jgi:Flp pilus assembly protein TadG
MSRVSHRRIGFRQRGIAAVEFAITLPLLLLLMFATAEFGRLISQNNTLAKCVRDAARYVAANATAGDSKVISITPTVTTQARNIAVTGQIAGGSPLLPGLTAGAFTIADAGNGYISVAATYTYQPMIAAQLPTFGLATPPTLARPLVATIIMKAL